ncbi:hypothetical protein IW261DRAFT_1426046 [Armillaria novae-zelandiae]|uniref:Uncharacterized protein n=1 Tax=Armillaria novae-zelandiae TaxID=153914 RepID=A0AA39NNV5_9AGAR|nr:hypothetical protein IW261DRAFT_1426046 [Armillaria novae-zelandiae]
MCISHINEHRPGPDIARIDSTSRSWRLDTKPFMNPHSDGQHVRGFAPQSETQPRGSDLVISSPFCSYLGILGGGRVRGASLGICIRTRPSDNESGLPLKLKLEFRSFPPCSEVEGFSVTGGTLRTAVWDAEWRKEPTTSLAQPKEKRKHTQATGFHLNVGGTTLHLHTAFMIEDLFLLWISGFLSLPLWGRISGDRSKVLPSTTPKMRVPLRGARVISLSFACACRIKLKDYQNQKQGPNSDNQLVIHIVDPQAARYPGEGGLRKVRAPQFGGLDRRLGGTRTGKLGARTTASASARAWRKYVRRRRVPDPRSWEIWVSGESVIKVPSAGRELSRRALLGSELKTVTARERKRYAFRVYVMDVCYKRVLNCRYPSPVRNSSASVAVGIHLWSENEFSTTKFWNDWVREKAEDWM